MTKRKHINCNHRHDIVHNTHDFTINAIITMVRYLELETAHLNPTTAYLLELCRISLQNTGSFSR